MKTSNPKGNDRSPESNVPRSNLVSKNIEMGHGNQRPKIEHVWAFMPVLATSNFVMMIQSKMNELAWRHHFPIVSLWETFKTSRAANSVVSGPIWLKFKFVRDFMHVLVTCKYKKDRIKTNWEKVETSFSHYKSMGAFCCHGNQRFDPICPKTLCSLSPTQMMLHIR